MYTYIAESIFVGDYLFVRADTDIPNLSLSNSRLGLYSVQDELAGKDIITNNYYDKLNRAKLLL